jgi:CheY-like chemotaxis protein
MADPKVAVVFSSDNRVETAVYPHDVFTPTDSGTAQIHDAATRLPAEALAVLVMLDGKQTVGDLEQKLPHIAPEVIRNMLRSLLAASLVRAVTMAESGDIGVDFSAFFGAAGGDPETSIGTQASAHREAESGAPKLEREGYYVSIARHALKARTPAAGTKLFAFVVEDDPDVSALVKRLMEAAGFDVAIAANRAEVVEQLRQKRIPDVAILDVMLPDLNGFDLLQRLKLHPVLKAIPVIMLTADAKRESVVRGLATGADGYITKPFDHTALVRGVKAVLGIGA